MIIGNPSRRRRRHKAKRAKSRRRHRKLSPLQRMYFGGGARVNPSKRRRHRRKAKSSIGGFIARRRRSSGGSRSYSIQGLMRSPIATLKPAFTGAVGAILVNTALQKLPVPPMLVTGRVRYVTQAAAAIGLAALAQRFAGVHASTAAKMAEGALTVTMVDAIRDVAGQFGVPLAGMGYYLPGYSAAMPAGPMRPAQQLGKYLTGPGSAASVIPMRRSALGGMRRVGNIGTSFGF